MAESLPIKTPGRLVGQSPEQFLPLSTESLVVAELAMGQLREMQSGPKDLTRVIIHASEIGSATVRAAAA